MRKRDKPSPREYELSITRLYMESENGEEMEMTMVTPLKVKMFREDGLWVIKNEELNIHCWGNTMDKALTMLLDEMEFLKREIYLEDDLNLNKDSIKLKKMLSEIFG